MGAIMKKSIKELALDLTSSAQTPFTFGIKPKGIKGTINLKSLIIDYEDYFVSSGRTTAQFKEFCAECEKLGFDVLPIEQSELALFTHLHGKKLVIQQKANA